MEIILANPIGFCYGVNRAVKGAFEQAEKNKDKNIYCLGELVHNKDVVHELENKADDVVHDMENYIIKDFLPPIDRDDINLIIRKLRN